MPKTEQVIYIFIASPGDTKEERARAKKVIDELNLSYPKDKGVRLATIMWEDSTYPAYGEDVQAIINDQIGNDYDVLVGILWSRFGTPTERAGSGTEEEFNRAVARRAREKDTPKIMIFFNRKPIDIDSIDPDQIKLVKNFKEKVKTKARVADFNDTMDFEASLRIFLTQYVNDTLRKKSGVTKSESAKNKHKPKAPTSGTKRTSVSRKPSKTHKEAHEGGNLATEDNLGLLDLQEKFATEIRIVIEITQSFNKEVSDLGLKTEKRYEEISRLQSVGAGNSPDMRNVFSMTANDLCSFAEKVDSQSVELNLRFRSAIDYYIKSLQIFSEDFISGNENRRSELDDAINTMKETGSIMPNTRLQLRTLRNTISRIPRLTKEMNQAKNRAASALNSMEKVLLSIEEILINIKIQSVPG